MADAPLEAAIRASERRVLTVAVVLAAVLAGLVVATSLLVYSAIPEATPDGAYLGYSPIWEQDAERQARAAWPATTAARNAYLTWLEQRYGNNQEAAFRRVDVLKERVNGGRATYEEYVEAYQLAMIFAARRR